jgi:hypothetical protein
VPPPRPARREMAAAARAAAISTARGTETRIRANLAANPSDE